MDCENYFEDWTQQEPPPPIPDPLQEAEDLMIRKYGVDRSFIDVYVQHASERTALDLVKNFLLLPPGREDAQVMEKTIRECTAALERHDREYDARKAAATKEMARLTAEKSKATNEKDKQECEAQARVVMNDYFKFALTSWKALHTLNECSKKIPINALEFHNDMQNFARMVIGLRIKVHFPALADAVM